MNERLKATVERLEALGIAYRVIDLGGPAVRTRDVLDKVDVDPEGIVKTILFKRKSDGTPFAVAVRGKDRVSYKKVRALVDSAVSPLHPDEMRGLGWEPGECCPLTVPGPLFVDPSVMELQKINTGSGDLQYGLEYAPEAITQYRESAEIVDVRA